MDDREKILSEATKWLLELEHVNNPQIKNALILNIAKVSPAIQDVDLLLDSNSKKLLVWLQLSWFARHFSSEPIQKDVLDVLSAALPSFAIRVIQDRALFDKALVVVKKLALAPKPYYE